MSKVKLAKIVKVTVSEDVMGTVAVKETVKDMTEGHLSYSKLLKTAVRYFSILL